MRILILRCVVILRSMTAALLRAARALLRAARRVGSALAEADRQQRRHAALVASLDRYLPHPDAAPDTYAEFLARTRGILVHEPSARARLAGRSVR